MDSPSSISVSFNIPVSYEVQFSRQIFSEQNTLVPDFFKKHGRPPHLVIVADRALCEAQSELAQQCSQALQRWGYPSDNLLVLRGGETLKNSKTALDELYKFFEEKHCCRHSLVIALGGGALIDAVGYAVSTCHRGLRLLRCPSTVLAQNDAGIGVKNGINAFGKKNFLGTFQAPEGVINDFSLLSSLSTRSTIAGYAEAIKVSLLKDPTFFHWIHENANDLKSIAQCRDKGEALKPQQQEQLEHLIHQCAKLHVQHIQQGGDPFEKGSSRPLDFGHWSAHRLEQLNLNHIQHGEAVALGMCWDTLYANAKGWLSDDDTKLIVSTIRNCGLPTEHSLFKRPDAILSGLEEFREHLGGQLTIPMLRTVGEVMDIHEVDLEVYRELSCQLCPRGGVD